MKKFLRVFLAINLVLGLIFLSTPLLNKNQVVLAQEKSNFTLGNNKIRLRVFKGSSFNSSWGELGFTEIGNNQVKLRPIYNGKPVHYSEFPENVELAKSIEIKIIDDKGYVNEVGTFSQGVSIKFLSKLLEEYTLTYGINSIQIIPYYDNNPFTITGNVKANLDYYDYETKISKKQANDFKFRVESDGLYAEYIHQTVVPDDEYIIETSSNLNNVLSHENTVDILSINFNNSLNQKFLFKYDNKNKAYKIISQKNGYLLSYSEHGSQNTYMTYDNNFSGQLWYLQKLPNKNYRIVNSLNPSNRITFNLNNNKIHTEYMKNDITQEFRIVKSSERLNFLSGKFKISSELDENKVLTADTWNYNVNIFLNENKQNQEWLFQYHPSKDAYTIASVYNPRIVLALDVFGDPENVVVSSFTGNIVEQFWKLDQSPDGYFIIKSAKNENLVIDVPRNDSSNGNNIKVYQRKYSNNSNQKFKFSK